MLFVFAGQACIGQYSEDECFYRAEIIAVRHNLAAVLFVDYGSSEWLPFNRYNMDFC